MKVDPISAIPGSSAQPPQPPQFTNREKRDELAREVNRRKADYPGQVRQGRMRQEEADRRKAIMHAVWLDYCGAFASQTQEQRAQEESSPPQPTLIGIDPGAGELQHSRQALNSMAHAGDGDSAHREAGARDFQSSDRRDEPAKDEPSKPPKTIHSGDSIETSSTPADAPAAPAAAASSD